MKKSLFHHVSQVRVRNYEVDWQGIVHNANYLLYFEVARLEYLKQIGVKVDMQSIQGDSRVVLVRNELDYRASARFDDLLTVHTRISYINETSFAFEGLMEESLTQSLIAENVAVHVWLGAETGAPVRVNDEFRHKVRAFEGENVAIRSQEP
jgi:acyl-CoA thioester hydrolase